MALYPITETGSTTTLLTYAEGDFIGVEDAATSSTDHLGFNEIADYTYRLDQTLQIEHYSNGCHNSVRLARAVIILDWDGTTYNVNDNCYVQTTAGVVTRGGGITVTRLGAGDIQIDLTNALTTGPTMIVDLTPASRGAAGVVERVNVLRHTYTSTTRFNIRRYEGTTVANQVLTDGYVYIMAHT